MMQADSGKQSDPRVVSVFLSIGTTWRREARALRRIV
jgi:hypothetical protein